MKVAEVALGERSYPIYIGKNIWHNIPAVWPGRVKRGNVLLVSDEHVFPLYGGRLIGQLHEAGFGVRPAVLPAGEESKTLKSAGLLYDAAIEAGLDRHGVIVALGGGVVGDVAGFAASTYLRGVPFIQAPTTLLAQVDSSVGGKVAVNHPRGKNLIGSFYQPRLVWSELETLASLPARQFRAGLAEVVKYGVIASEPFFCYLDENWDALLALEPAVLTDVVAECCTLKAAVVVKDEREAGLRAILNFGHTLGHALEAATAYTHYLHGEAVLAGMVMATHLAVSLKILHRAEAERLLSMYARIGLTPPPPGLCRGDVVTALGHDKKREGEAVIFILPVTIGKTKLVRSLDPALVEQVLAAYLDGGEGSLRLAD